jgi:hypothetical protein
MLLLRFLINGMENLYRSDNSALLWLLTSPNLPPQAARWALLLMYEPNFRVVHLAGSLNVVADYFSRPTAETQSKGACAKWPASAAESEAALAVMVASLLPSPHPSRGCGLGMDINLSEETFFLLHLISSLVTGRVALLCAAAAHGFPAEEMVSHASPPMGLLFVLRGSGPPRPSTVDIWEDQDTLRYLRAAVAGEDVSATLTGLSLAERDRVKQRARPFYFETSATTGGELLFHLSSSAGTGRIVPPPAERDALVTELHSPRGQEA